MGADLWSLIDEHETWRGRCISLMPSENAASPAVMRALGSDLGNRYTLPMHDLVHGFKAENAYSGTRLTDAIEARGEELAREVFRCGHASLKPLSGHVSAMLMLLAACRRGDRMMTIHARYGGYDGYMPEYIPEMFGLETSFLPFDETAWTVDSEAAAEAIRRDRPRLVVLGLSFFLFPYNMGPLADACRDAGAVIGYDGSHVLGLIAGNEFQDPLREGTSMLVGSTHKTFFGPQGGIFLTDDDELFAQYQKCLTWKTLDNAHWNRIAAMAQALAEMKEFGPGYAKQVISNSRALAKALDELGFAIKFKQHGYTASHQVHSDNAAIEQRTGKGMEILVKRLEENGLLIDYVGRLGTNEATRLGMKEKDMETIASLVARCALEGETVRPEVEEFRAGFTMEYFFE